MRNPHKSLRARAVAAAFESGSLVLPPLRARALANLPPEVARWTPPITPLARMLRDEGGFVVVGKVGGFDDSDGSGTTNIRMDFPELAKGGGGSGLSIPFDLEAARYLPPRTRVRLTLEIMGPEEEE